jgi:hypothetical protein
MAKKSSAGVLLYRHHDELEVFLVHPGSKPRNVNSSKRPVSISTANFVASTPSSKPAAKSFRHGQSRRIATRHSFIVIASPSNGRQNRERRGSFRKSTVPAGSRCPKPGQRFSRDKSDSSISSFRCCEMISRRRHADLISGARESLSFSEASFVIKTDEAHRGGKNQEESSCDL